MCLIRRKDGLAHERQQPGLAHAIGPQQNNTVAGIDPKLSCLEEKPPIGRGNFGLIENNQRLGVAASTAQYDLAG